MNLIPPLSGFTTTGITIIEILGKVILDTLSSPEHNTNQKNKCD